MSDEKEDSEGTYSQSDHEANAECHEIINGDSNKRKITSEVTTSKKICPSNLGHRKISDSESTYKSSRPISLRSTPKNVSLQIIHSNRQRHSNADYVSTLLF